MLQFLLYCDLSTMNCTAQDINAELSKFADSYVQATDSLWFFRYPDGFDGNPLPREEHLFRDHFKKFAGEDGIIFIEIMKNDYFYNLPDSAHQFLCRE